MPPIKVVLENDNDRNDINIVSKDGKHIASFQIFGNTPIPGCYRGWLVDVPKINTRDGKIFNKCVEE